MADGQHRRAWPPGAAWGRHRCSLLRAAAFAGGGAMGMDEAGEAEAFVGSYVAQMRVLAPHLVLEKLGPLRLTVQPPGKAAFETHLDTPWLQSRENPDRCED